MKERDHCTPGVCPGAPAPGETVSLSVAHHQPLLQRKRALPWEALCEVMRRHGRWAGKNTAGRPGLRWAVALSVPWVGLRLGQQRHARAREAYVAEPVVARLFMGPQDEPSPQRRDQANMARAYAALGTEGVDAIKARRLHVAKEGGGADPRILSSETTAQAVPMGYPNAPGLLRGWAQRGGGALAQRTTRGGGGSRSCPGPGPDDAQVGHSTPPGCHGHPGPAAGGDAPAHRGGPGGGAHPA